MILPPGPFMRPRGPDPMRVRPWRHCPVDPFFGGSDRQGISKTCVFGHFLVFLDPPERVQNGPKVPKTAKIDKFDDFCCFWHFWSIFGPNLGAQKHQKSPKNTIFSRFGASNSGNERQKYAKSTTKPAHGACASQYFIFQ